MTLQLKTWQILIDHAILNKLLASEIHCKYLCGLVFTVCKTLFFVENSGRLFELSNVFVLEHNTKSQSLKSDFVQNKTKTRMTIWKKKWNKHQNEAHMNDNDMCKLMIANFKAIIIWHILYESHFWHLYEIKKMPNMCLLFYMITIVDI